jgi:hypothetical protein
VKTCAFITDVFMYCILSSIVCTFYIENDAEIFPVHYTWKVTEKGVKMAFMMNKFASLFLVKLFLKNINIFFAKIHCEFQVRTILVCALYSIKYSTNIYNYNFLEKKHKERLLRAIFKKASFSGLLLGRR